MPHGGDSPRGFARRRRCAAGRDGVAGFTLVEVLVALIIVGLGMAALLGSLTAAADSTIYLRDKTFAQWIALNRIAETRLQRQPPSLGKSQGDIDFAGRKWRWEQEVMQLEGPGLLRLDVHVRPADQRDGSWLTTVSGVRGDAISPNPAPAIWDALSQSPRGGGDQTDDRTTDGGNDADGSSSPGPQP